MVRVIVAVQDVADDGTTQASATVTHDVANSRSNGDIRRAITATADAAIAAFRGERAGLATRQIVVDRA